MTTVQTIKIQNFEMNVLPETSAILNKKGYVVLVIKEITGIFYNMERLINGLELAKKQSIKKPLNLNIDCSDVRTVSQVNKDSVNADKWLSLQKSSNDSRPYILSAMNKIKKSNPTII